MQREVAAQRAALEDAKKAANAQIKAAQQRAKEAEEEAAVAAAAAVGKGFSAYNWKVRRRWLGMAWGAAGGRALRRLVAGLGLCS